MRKIYIVLSFTGTWLSRAVRIYTRKEFSHVSIALDKDLDYMYSFGRINVNNPFWGGFVHEVQNKGVFEKFYNTKSVIYPIEVNEQQYKKIKKSIKKFKASKDLYGFNMIGLIGAGLNIRISRKNKFYCAEFVKYILDNAGVDLELPDVVKPQDFLDASNGKFIYRGKFNEYNSL